MASPSGVFGCWIRRERISVNHPHPNPLPEGAYKGRYLLAPFLLLARMYTQGIFSELREEYVILMVLPHMYSKVAPAPPLGSGLRRNDGMRIPTPVSPDGEGANWV